MQEKLPNIPKISVEELNKDLMTADVVPSFDKVGMNTMNKEEIDNLEISNYAKEGELSKIQDINFKIFELNKTIKLENASLEKFEEELDVLNKLIEEEGPTNKLLSQIKIKDEKVASLRWFINENERKVKELKKYLQNKLVDSN